MGFNIQTHFYRDAFLYIFFHNSSVMWNRSQIDYRLPITDDNRLPITDQNRLNLLETLLQYVERRLSQCFFFLKIFDFLNREPKIFKTLLLLVSFFDNQFYVPV